jgi:hypothetical protein
MGWVDFFTNSSGHPVPWLASKKNYFFWLLKMEASKT